jgi:uncharacterized BrkB/YihY/UPF0761 family membrane protein
LKAQASQFKNNANTAAATGVLNAVSAGASGYSAINQQANKTQCCICHHHHQWF